LSSCFFGKEETNNIKEFKNEENINNDLWNIKKEIDYQEECKNVILWKWDKDIFWWKKIYGDYIKSLENLEKNEYENQENLKKWKCDEFVWENKDFCEKISNSEFVWSKWEYDYQLTKSIIEKNNFCNDIIEKWSEDFIQLCNRTYKNYFAEKIEITSIKLNDSNNKKWNFLLSVWKEKYKKVIDNLFLEECLNNDKE
jgi:hypothetical protein